MKRNLTLLLVVWLSACATTPTPRSFDQATTQLEQVKESDVASSQPKLVADGIEALSQAREALQAGDYERADLLAQIANARFGAARNLAVTEEAVTQSAAMSDATTGLAAEQARVELESQALAHFLSVQAQFDSATAELQRYAGIEGQARESLAKARSKQAEAIAKGAPTLATSDYEQGRVLVESALQQIQTSGYQQCLDLSQQAITAFEVAISKSGESDVALRRQRQAAETDGQKNLQAKTAAQDAIDEAKTARASAVATSPNASNSGSFKKGELLLTQATDSLESGRYAAATKAANEATTAFKAGESGGFGLDAAKTAIRRAEDSRAAAMGRGISADDPALRKGDFSLDLARTAFTGGDYERALETANAAKTAYEQTNVIQSVGFGVIAAPKNGQMGLANDAVVARILKVQMARAEALGKGLDRTCADDFREFEAILQMAEGRLAAGDNANAFEFAIRAEERLKKCDRPVVKTETTTKKAVEPAKTQASATQVKADIEQKEAAKTLAEAQIQLAKLESDPVLQKDLAESRLLVQKADEWFGRAAYTESLQFSTLANRKMAELSGKKTPKAVIEPVKAVTKTKDAKTEKPEPTKVCSTDDGYESLAKSAKTRVFAMRLTTEQSELAAEASRQIDAGTRLKTSGMCDDASLMFRGALRTLAEIEKPVAAGEKTVAKTNDPKNPNPTVYVVTENGSEKASGDPTKQTAQTKEPKATPVAKGDRVAATEALASARRVRASVPTTDTSASVKVGNSLLREAEARFQAEQFDESAALARQAEGAFKSVLTTPDNTAWKASYESVLSALVERDRAKTVVSADTKVVFERGVGFVEKARGAWSKQDYQAAGTFAEAAKGDFLMVVKAEGQKKDEASKARAAELAAKDAQAKKDAAEAAKSANAGASDAIRDAELRASKCDQACQTLAPEDAKQGQLLLRDAKAALSAGDSDKAQALAEKASNAFARADAVRPTLQLPQGMTLAGDRLLVSPKVEFESGSDRIAAGSLETLRLLGQALRDGDLGYRSLTIVGFTDSRGNDKKNLALSKARATAVQKALTSAGANASKLTANGRGEEQPISSNDTAEGRADNRRVELIIELDSTTQVNHP